MLTPEQLRKLVETLQPEFDNLNTFITIDIIERLMARLSRGEMLQLTGTDEWQIETYKNLGGQMDALTKEIRRFTNATKEEVREIFKDAAIQAYEADEKFYEEKGMEKQPMSETMKQIVEDIYERTNGELENYTRTTASKAQADLIKIIDEAYMKTESGAVSYSEAINEAVEQASEIQPSVVYPTGHVDSVETAVTRAVRTGIAQASGNMAMQDMIDHNWDLVRVSAHIGARYGDGGENPGNHYWWQGKLYTRTGENPDLPDFISSTGYGTGEGLSGWNCRHSFGPGDRDFNPWQKFDEEENKKAYDLSQEQRRMERELRNRKRKALAYKKAKNLTDDEKTRKLLSNQSNIENAKLAKQQKDYEQFCKDNKLPTQDERIEEIKNNRVAESSTSVTEDDIIKELEETGEIPKDSVVHFIPSEIDVDSLIFDGYHIQTERKRNIDFELAKKWIRDASISVSAWNNNYEKYYGRNGSVYVNLQKSSIRTAYSKEFYGPKLQKLIEVLSKYNLLK